MANEKNLENGIATQFQSGEEAARSGKKGGIASGESRRKRKAFKQRLREAMDASVTNENLRRQVSEFGMDADNATNEDLLVSSLLISALVKNDINAIEMVLSYLGESPKEKREAQRSKAQNRLTNAKAEALERMSDEEIEIEDDGFIEALNGKADNTDWNDEN